MPGHSDEKTSIMAVIGWPPGLAIGHEVGEVTFHSLIIETFKLSGIIKASAVRARLGAVLVKDVDRKLVGPPVAIGLAQ